MPNLIHKMFIILDQDTQTNMVKKNFRFPCGYITSRYFQFLAEQLCDAFAIFAIFINTVLKMRTETFTLFRDCGR